MAVFNLPYFFTRADPELDRTARCVAKAACNVMDIRMYYGIYGHVMEERVRTGFQSSCLQGLCRIVNYGSSEPWMSPSLSPENVLLPAGNGASGRDLVAGHSVLPVPTKCTGAEHHRACELCICLVMNTDSLPVPVRD